MPRPRIVSAAAAALALAAAGPAARADIASWTSGHGDIGIEYDAGAAEFELHWHVDGGTVDGVSNVEQEYEADELRAVVPDSAGQNYDTVPNGLGFTGVQPDGNSTTSDAWILPQNDAGDRPYLGFATEEGFGGSDFDSIELSLTGFSGPGEFSIWTINPTNGQPVDLVATANGIDAAVDDFFSLPELSHEHYNLWFTAEGLYDIEFTATGVLTGGGGTISDTANFQFQVGTPAAVPEPGSVALIGLAACGLVGGTRRRQRAAAAAGAEPGAAVDAA